MTHEEIKTACDQIAMVYRSHGEKRALSELALLNQKLAPGRRVHFQAPAKGNYLAFFLHDTGSTGKELNRWTFWWTPGPDT